MDSETSPRPRIRGGGLGRTTVVALPFVNGSVGTTPYKRASCEELVGKDGFPGRDSFARHWLAKDSKGARVVCREYRRSSGGCITCNMDEGWLVKRIESRARVQAARPVTGGGDGMMRRAAGVVGRRAPRDAGCWGVGWERGDESVAR